MRILFAGCRPGYPERMTGAAVSTHFLAEALAANGAAVHLFCAKAQDAEGASAGMPATCYTLDRVTDPMAELPAAVKSFAPDFAVLTAGTPVAMARCLADLGVPIVVYQRDSGADLLREISTWTDDPLLGVFSCSQFVASDIARLTGHRAAVLPNIFRRRDYAVPAAGRMVTFINPVPAKGVDLVLALAARHQDMAFLFVEGWAQPPKQQAVLRRRTDRLGNIAWQARTVDMRPVYAKTRILLVPSQWREAWGRVATEAQISGIPVLASDRGGLPESVGDGGLLLPRDDLDAWSNSLHRVMTDERLWSELSARAAARSRRASLDPNRIVAEFICQTRDWLHLARRRNRAA